MNQIAEKPAAERIVPHILYDAAGVGIRMRFLHGIGRGLREACQQQGHDIVIPRAVNYGFVSKYGITLESRAQDQERGYAENSLIHSPESAQLWCRIPVGRVPPHG